MNYVAPPWLPGGNLQTIWPALYARRVHGAPPQYRRERWATPDDDFIDVDHLVTAHPAANPPQTLLVLFHGLEGSSASHYAQAFADFARSVISAMWTATRLPAVALTSWDVKENGRSTRPR